MHDTSHRRRSEAGFTLVEVLAAALILAIGVMGTFTLLDTANRTAGANNARVGATNLAREISEYARGADYDLLQPGQVEPALRTRARIAGPAGAWTLERRGVIYTVTASVCTFDDPKDGLAATPPPNVCTPGAAAIAGAQTEVNPDDFRRVTVRLTWRDRSGNHALTQNTLVVNPSGGLGPRITDFPAPAAQITAGTSVGWTLATNPVKTTPAAALALERRRRREPGRAHRGECHQLGVLVGPRNTGHRAVHARRHLPRLGTGLRRAWRPGGDPVGQCPHQPPRALRARQRHRGSQRAPRRCGRPRLGAQPRARRHRLPGLARRPARRPDADLRGQRAHLHRQDELHRHGPA